METASGRLRRRLDDTVGYGQLVFVSGHDNKDKIATIWTKSMHLCYSTI